MSENDFNLDALEQALLNLSFEIDRLNVRINYLEEVISTQEFSYEEVVRNITDNEFKRRGL